MRIAKLATVMTLLTLLSGCIFSVHGKPIKPEISLAEWKIKAYESWKEAPIKNGYEQRGEYASKWIGCRLGYLLSDNEVGFCQGFYFHKFLYDENISRMQQVDLMSIDSNSEDKYISIPSSDRWTKNICGDGSRSHVDRSAAGPDFDLMLMGEMYLGKVSSTQKWTAGCKDGVNFGIKLRKLFEKSNEGSALIRSYHRFLSKALNELEKPTNYPDEDKPYNSSFIDLLKDGRKVGNILYEQCSNDAKMLIENGTDPNSNFYAQLGNSLMIKIPAGPQKKLCGTAYVDVKDVYNYLMARSSLAAAQFLYEKY
jgi:hypothetical protein